MEKKQKRQYILISTLNKERFYERYDNANIEELPLEYGDKNWALLIIKWPSLPLLELQFITGGLIELFPVRQIHPKFKYDLWVNEEGMINGLPINHMTVRYMLQPIFGDFCICGCDHQTGDSTLLTLAEVGEAGLYLTPQTKENVAQYMQMILKQEKEIEQ